MRREIVIGIYKITSPSGAINIGQSWNIDKRWGQYRNLQCKTQIKLYNSLKIYGPENHTFEKWEVFPDTIYQEYIDEREVYWIKFYKDQGYELLTLCEGGRGGKKSEETKKRMSEANKRRPPMSEETKRKISEKAKGRKMSDEDKKKMSERMKGNTYIRDYVSTEEHHKNIKGYKHTEESKKKMSDSHKDNPHIVSPEGALSRSRKLSELKKGKPLVEGATEKAREVNRGNQYRKGILHSEEDRKRIKEGMLRAKDKISASRMGNTNKLGYKFTQEQKDKMREKRELKKKQANDKGTTDIPN